MKNTTTSDDFTTAIRSARGRLSGPKSTRDTAKVVQVSATSAIQTST
jgi:hypothetical protein